MRAGAGKRKADARRAGDGKRRNDAHHKGPAQGQAVARSARSGGMQAHDERARRHRIASNGMQRQPAAQSSSRPGAFVDARRLQSEDALGKTLRETSGGLGVATRPKVVDFKARVKERRKASIRAVAIRVSIIAAAVAAVAAIVWLLFFSPALRLDASKIAVSGDNAWVGKSQILDIAQQQAGKSLLLVSDSEVQDALKAIPGVSQAKATKKFPDGLEVSVTAQRPAAMLKASGSDTLTAVDSQGRVLNAVAKDTSVEGIPVIDVDSVDEAIKSKGVRSALVILNELPEWLRKEISSVTAQTQDSITTKLSNGITVVWGDDNDIELKSAIVDKIINDPDVIGDKKNVDVSAPSRPIIK